MPVRVVNLETFAGARVRPYDSRGTVECDGVKEELKGGLRFGRPDWERVEDSRSSLVYTKPQRPFWTRIGWDWTLLVEEINERLSVQACG